MLKSLIKRLFGLKVAQPEIDIWIPPGNDAIKEKLCTVCKFRSENFVGGEDFSKCDAPSNMRLDRSNGRKLRVYSYCSVHRDGEHPAICGTSGRWFEAVELVKVECAK